MNIAGLDVRIIRKGIKNLHLGVYPPDGHIRVSAPWVVSDDAVRQAVITKLGWIKRQQQHFMSQERQSEREMLNGESHYFLGHRYRLKIVPTNGNPRVLLPNKSFMELHVKDGSTAEYRRKILANWYRRQLRMIVPDFMAKWEKALDVKVQAWGIKKMKTKWGSCNPALGRIWLNLELTKKPIHCLEYVIAHELAHLIEPSHSQRFIRLLNNHLPLWESHKRELNASPLIYENWIQTSPTRK